MEIERTIKYSDGGMATGLVGEDQVKDLSFKIRVKEMPKSDTILLHEVVTIETFDLGDEKNISFEPFHIIFGDSSLAIFDALGVDEVAGLKRSDCVDFLENLKKQGKTERDGSFIAGLCNFSGKNIFMFFNVQRLNFKGFASRVLPHEALHLARLLITLKENKWIKDNLTTPEWYLDPKATFVDMKDDNEEFFAETLERTSAIAMDAWQRITGEKCYMDGGGIEDETKEISDEHINSIIEDISDYKIYGSAEGDVDAETITFYGDYNEEDKNYNIEIIFKVDDPYADYEYISDDPDETIKISIPSYHLQSIVLIEDDMYNIQLTDSQKEKLKDAIQEQFDTKIAAAYDYALRMDAYESIDPESAGSGVYEPKKYFMKDGGDIHDLYQIIIYNRFGDEMHSYIIGNYKKAMDNLKEDLKLAETGSRVDISHNGEVIYSETKKQYKNGGKFGNPTQDYENSVINALEIRHNLSKDKAFELSVKGSDIIESDWVSGNLDSNKTANKIIKKFHKINGGGILEYSNGGYTKSDALIEYEIDLKKLTYFMSDSGVVYSYGVEKNYDQGVAIKSYYLIDEDNGYVFYNGSFKKDKSKIIPIDLKTSVDENSGIETIKIKLPIGIKPFYLDKKENFEVKRIFIKDFYDNTYITDSWSKAQKYADENLNNAGSKYIYVIWKDNTFYSSLQIKGSIKSISHYFNGFFSSVYENIGYYQDKNLITKTYFNKYDDIHYKIYGYSNEIVYKPYVDPKRLLDKKDWKYISDDLKNKFDSAYYFALYLEEGWTPTIPDRQDERNREKLERLIKEYDQELSKTSKNRYIEGGALEYANGGGFGDKPNEDQIALYYITDYKGKVWNISKTEEQANETLNKFRKSPNFDGGYIKYAIVNKKDYESEKINVSNIKNYRADQPYYMTQQEMDYATKKSTEWENKNQNESLYKNGGNVYDDYAENVSNEEIEGFIDYFMEAYNILSNYSIYSKDEDDIGEREEEIIETERNMIRRAILEYFDELQERREENYTWGGGDTLDRERVKIFYDGYFKRYKNGGGVGMAMEGMFLDDDFERMVEKLKNYLAKYPYIWTRGNKRYVPIEGWQYAAALMGLSSRVKNVNEVQPGVWQAEADVVDKRSGVVNCSGFGIVNKAEHKWAKKDEDIINFVQTRAVSRALRNCISYLIKAAGYSTTPAEEMYGLASEEKKKKGMPSSIKPVKGVSEDDFIFDRPEYNEGMTQPPFPKEEVPITKYVPREEIPQEDMLRKVWAESKANGIVIRSAEFMNEIELALTDETIGTETQIKSLLMESYNWLTENGIMLRSKIFMKKFKDSL